MNGYAAATQYAQTAGMAPAGAAMYGAAPGAAASGPSMVVIRCLPPSVDRLKLYEAYAPYGGILSVIINPDRSAAIRYVDHTSARRATDSTNNTRLDGGVVYVELQP